MKAMKIKISGDGFVFFQEETSAQEYNIFESNSLFLPQKRASKCTTPYILIAVYEEPAFYENHKEVELKDVHLPGIRRKAYREVYAKVFFYYFKEGKEKKVKQIFLSHDHDSKGKCFIEICVFFEEIFNALITPGSFVVVGGVYPLFKESRFLFLVQKPRDNAIQKYFSKKEGDFFYYDDTIKDIYFFLQGKEIIKDIIQNNKNDSDESNINNNSNNSDNNSDSIILSNNNANGFIRKNNKENDYDKRIKEKEEDDKNNIKKSPIKSINLNEDENESEVSEFKWIKNNAIFSKYPTIRNWFEKITKNDTKYKKALLIYSDLPNMGKSQFAKGLINNLDYAIIMNKKFTMPNDVKISPKLLIIINLEEFGLSGGDFLNLISRKDFHIEEEGVERLWNFKIPCIITTRSFDLIRALYKNKTYSSKIVFIEVNEYIGPPGKQMKILEDVEAWFTKRTWEFIRLKEQSYRNGNKSINRIRKRERDSDESIEDDKDQ